MQQQVVENDKLSALHQRVYQKHGDAIGKRIAHEF